MKKSELLLGGLIMVTCVGFGMILTGMFWRGIDTAKARATSDSLTPEGAHPDSLETEQRLAVLEGKLRSLQRLKQTQGPEEAAGAEALAEEEAALVAMEDPEVQKERISGEFLAHRQVYVSQSVDPKWSREAAASLNDSLIQIPGTKFEVSDLDCRSTMCIGYLKWPEGAQMFDEAKKIAEYAYPTNCSTAVYMGNADDGADPGLGARIVFDCSQMRAGGI